MLITDKSDLFPVKKRCFFEYADKCVTAILYLMENYHTSLLSAVPDGVLNNYRIRLTKYSKVICLSFYLTMTACMLVICLCCSVLLFMLHLLGYENKLLPPLEFGRLLDEFSYTWDGLLLTPA